MPREIKSSEQFEKLMPKAVQLRVVREKEFVKLKLRTPDFLYTYKTTEDDAGDIIKNAKEIEVVEFGKVKEKSSDEKKKDKEESEAPTSKKKKK